jgi:LPXTG-motif cell wall-anchored protein
VGTLIVLPIVVDRYFPGVLPAALSLVGVGLLLVVTAVFVARRRRRTPTTSTSDQVLWPVIRNRG